MRTVGLVIAKVEDWEMTVVVTAVMEGGVLLGQGEDHDVMVVKTDIWEAAGC